MVSKRPRSLRPHLATVFALICVIMTAIDCRNLRFPEKTLHSLKDRIDSARISLGDDGDDRDAVLTSTRRSRGEAATSTHGHHAPTPPPDPRTNTAFAKKFNEDTIAYSQQFLPLQLRDGSTGINTDVCHPHISPNQRSLFVAIGILTGPDNKERRDAIRETWAKWAQDNSRLGPKHELTAIYRFFAAIPPLNSRTSFEELENEAIKYGDMVILGHVDSKLTIPKKTVAIMAWGSDICGAYFTAKTDDDAFVHVPNLVSWALTHNPMGVFAGVHPRSLRFHPWREKGSNYYITVNEFPFKEAPCYHFGAFIVASRDIASHVGALRNIPGYMWLRYEDVMLSIRVREAGGLVHKGDDDCFEGVPVITHELGNDCAEGLARIDRREEFKTKEVVAVHGLNTGDIGKVMRNFESGVRSNICNGIKIRKTWTENRGSERLAARRELRESH
eukprot:TRINITY_DN88_c1_g1_i1.p1 TRINITY_DN88_c1_g1~~TRINITY_DN88_c1_g1_i1.p1  ORF type:complete len:446 (+),score=41.85 TRINITY_DN88_c1_g1_i1:149-1486(+)